jgi:Na+-translocating ferredoxin:NAD+ oxidoreductase RnfG subunit
MHETFRWLIPAALSAAASPACYAVQYMTAEQARTLMFPDAGEFAPAPLKLSRAQVQAIEEASGVRVRVPEQQVWQARAEGRVLGWFIVDEVYGKHEFITYAVGLNLDGSVRQIEVLDYRETYGYEIRHPAWRHQFVGKRQGDTLKLDADIKNISGATLSCRHITDGVKRLLALHQVALKPTP